jgi:hypothetical protein
LSTTQETKFRFVIRNQDPQASEADIRKRLKQATTAAVKESQANNAATQASTQLEGGLFGIGETAVILFVAHAVKAGAAAAALGGAGAAGKDFYTAYLAPQLRKWNLLPSKLKEFSSAEERKKPAKKRAAKKQATKKSSK